MEGSSVEMSLSAAMNYSIYLGFPFSRDIDIYPKNLVPSAKSLLFELSLVTTVPKVKGKGSR